MHGSFLEVFREKMYQLVSQYHHPTYFPGFSLADCQLSESYQPMRNKDALDVMLRFN